MLIFVGIYQVYMCVCVFMMFDGIVKGSRVLLPASSWYRMACYSISCGVSAIFRAVVQFFVPAAAATAVYMVFG